MKKLIVKRIGPDLYNRCLTFMYGTKDQIDKAMARIEKEHYEPMLERNRAKYQVYVHNSFQADYILLRSDIPVGERYPVLAHEVFHFVHMSLQTAGVRLTDDSEEAYAYYISDIMERCLNAIERKR